ncbi:MAG: alkane 1-monooxygenase [Myxococcota bacterium]
MAGVFLLAYLLPATHALGLSMGGGWSWFPVAFIFVITPVLDGLLGQDESNPEPRRRWLYDLCLWAWVPVQSSLLIWTLGRVGAGTGSGLELGGWVFSMGLVAGAGGITVAHELMHRPRQGERALAEILMTLVSYPHFCVEHVFGHHRNVATPLDPATARSGESVYRFLPRTLRGGFMSFWRIEADRVRKHGRRGWADARIRYALLLVFAYVGVAAGFGATGVLVFAAQGVVAVLLLEIINYVEHYGLLRTTLGEADGRWERVRPHHSWNSSHRLTNAYLFHLPRHADHHAVASRPYHLLRHEPEGPQLPAGYATMVLVALLPPLWFHLMDPRVARAVVERGQAQGT